MPTASVAICPGWQIPECWDNMHGMFNRIVTRKVQKHFLATHRAILEPHNRQAYALASNAKSLQELHDDRVVRAFMGYPTREAYCEAMSQRPGRELLSPILVISSADDPVCSNKNIDYEFFKAAPRAILAVSPRGSHLAFFTGKRGIGIGKGPKEATRSPNWAERATVQFLRHVLRQHSCETGESGSARTAKGLGAGLRPGA